MGSLCFISRQRTYGKCSPLSAFKCISALKSCRNQDYAQLQGSSWPSHSGSCLPVAHRNGRIALAGSYMTSQLPTETSIQQLRDLNTDNKGSHRYSLFLFTFRLFSNSFYLALLTLKGTSAPLSRKGKN